MGSKDELSRGRVDERFGFRLCSLIIKEEMNYRKLHNTSTVDLLEGVYKSYRPRKRNSRIYEAERLICKRGGLEVRHQAVWILTYNLTLKLFLWHNLDLSFLFVDVLLVLCCALAGNRVFG